MAKLKAPLLSLGAAGAIGKSLVFFNWKGLDVVREYVIPANPKTDPQNTQRGYMIACVDMIHYCQGLAANPFNADDASSYALLGSLQPTPRTWFNTVVRQWLKQRVASKYPIIFHGGTIDPGSLLLTVTMQHSEPEIGPTNGKLYYGTSKSALISSIDCLPGDLNAGKEITGLTKGVKYFVQYRCTEGALYPGANSGIWYGVPTA